MNEPQAILHRLQLLVGSFRSESGDVVIGRMIPELAALLVSIGIELDNAQRQMVRLTWAMFALAFVTLLVGGIQLYVSWPTSKLTEASRSTASVPALSTAPTPVNHSASNAVAPN